jgi:hypothetical protein
MLQVNFEQAVNLVQTLGSQVTFLFRGAPGQGKSSMLKELARRMPDYHVAYVDCANLDLGDLAMPVVDKEAMTTHYAPSARFGVARGQTRPVLLFLDELTKALKPVLNMLLPVLLEHRIADVPLPIGSRVFAAGNLDTDGVGDNFPAIAYNRCTVVDYANITKDEFLAWGMDNGITHEILKFSEDNPELFERYDMLENPKNPYVFNPLTGNTKTFWSPRSAEKASHIIKHKDLLGDALLPALAGTIGEPAARLLEAQVQLDAQLTPLPVIVADPMKAKLPEDVSGYFMMAFKLASRADRDTLGAFCKYVTRWESVEASHLFVARLCASKSKLPIIAQCREFTELSAKHAKYIR